MNYQNIAVLIDADNAGAKHIGAILESIGKMGVITCKKIYGDWGQANLSGWQSAILKYAIEPMQQFAYVKGKNATDIALVIEAMDLLHSEQYDAFCLVSSDSDFASLAVRIRKNNIPVFGFGEKKAIASFRDACDKFIEVESLANPNPANAQQLKKDSKLINALYESVNAVSDDEWSDYSQVAKFFKHNHSAINLKQYGYEKLIKLMQASELFSFKQEKDTSKLLVKAKQSSKFTTKALQNQQHFIRAINDIITQANTEWVNLSHIASQLTQANIDTKRYGYSKFSDLISAFRLFDIKKQPNGMFIKLKNQPTAQVATVSAAHSRTVNMSQLASTPLVLSQAIDVFIYADEQIDAVLWRLTADKKVRHDGDMIFYGQTHSDDGSITLDNNALYQHFHIKLHLQPAELAHLAITLTHESQPLDESVKVVIEQAGERIFEDKFEPTKTQGVLLFNLIQINTAWHFMPKNQAFTKDLRHLCDVFGIEVADD